MNIPKDASTARTQNNLHTKDVAAISLPKPCPVVYPINSTNISRTDFLLSISSLSWNAFIEYALLPLVQNQKVVVIILGVKSAQPVINK